MRRGDQISLKIKKKVEQSLKDSVFIKQVEEERKQKKEFQEGQSWLVEESDWKTASKIVYQVRYKGAFYSELFAAIFYTLLYLLRKNTILNSGSTIHIFNGHRRNQLRNLDPATVDDYIITRQSKIRIESFRDLTLWIQEESIRKILTISIPCFNAVYIEDFIINIVSLSQLQKKRW